MINFWLCWVFVAAWELSLVEDRLYFTCGSRASHCSGFFVAGHGLYGTWDSVVASVWNFHGPGIKLVSPPLAGGFLIIRPQEKVKVLVTQLCLTLGLRGL